jgi:hypothetical protein
MFTGSIARKGVLLGVFIFSLAFFIPSAGAHAQTVSSPQFLVTWKATESYIPPFYTGKALPTAGSKIVASVELVSDGRIVNISSQNIYWYLDDVLMGGGAGVQQITFPPFGRPPGSLDLKIELPQYPGGYLIHTEKIPFVNPAAVISAPYPNQSFSINPVLAEGIPFFFYATSSDNLLFNWAVNGQTGSNTENPQLAQITLPQGTPGGTPFDISLSISTPVGSTVAGADKTLTFQNQL